MTHMILQLNKIVYFALFYLEIIDEKIEIDGNSITHYQLNLG